MLLIKFSCDVFQLSTIGRCEYEKTCSLLVSLFDESASRYQEFISSGAQNSTIQIAVEQGTTVSLNRICIFNLKSKASFSLLSVYFVTFVHSKSVVAVLLIYQTERQSDM